MLLVLATLLVQALVNIIGTPIGVDRSRLLTARLDLPAWRYTTSTAIAQYDDQLLARVRQAPGVGERGLDRSPAGVRRRADHRGDDRRTGLVASRGSPLGRRGQRQRDLLLHHGHPPRDRPGLHAGRSAGPRRGGDRQPRDGPPLLGHAGSRARRAGHGLGGTPTRSSASSPTCCAPISKASIRKSTCRRGSARVRR